MLDDDLDNMVAENDISLDDIKESGLDDFLSDVNSDVVLQNASPFNNSAEESVDDTSLTVDEIVSENKETEKEEEAEEITEVAKLSQAQEGDFASLNMSDFDAALNSYKAARAGKATGMQIVTNHDQQANVNVSASEVAVNQLAEEKPPLMQASTVNDTDFDENDSERQQEIMNWYSGSLRDKSYRISVDNMPEFLDSDKTIRVIHVDVRSAYGWNVFFDNGVFMSLRDLKEYQERHGEMPCQDGKIIYGSKTCSFERILRVIVYEQPRYCSYKMKSE